MLDAVHHEVDNRLRCVDDTVCICHIFGEPLKKLLVKRIEEMLFLREVFAKGRCLLDSNVESVKWFEKGVTAHGVLHQHITDVFDFIRYDIPAGEI